MNKEKNLYTDEELEKIIKLVRNNAIFVFDQKHKSLVSVDSVCINGSIIQLDINVGED
jgi:hypothetical protein